MSARVNVEQWKESYWFINTNIHTYFFFKCKLAHSLSC